MKIKLAKILECFMYMYIYNYLQFFVYINFYLLYIRIASINKVTNGLLIIYLKKMFSLDEHVFISNFSQ